MYKLLSSSFLFILLLGGSARFITLVSAAPSEQCLGSNAELTAGYFEGDIILKGLQRNAVKNVPKWPNNMVYYKIADGHFHEKQLKTIKKGIKMIEDVSCIRFEEAPAGVETYVYITGEYSGCFSEIGFQDQKQILNFEPGCFKCIGTIVHEFLHTLGFAHMQSASNRDDYVEIMFDNIIDYYRPNFVLHNNTDHYGEEYDYGSVMHYPGNAFSKDQSNKEMRTIIPKRKLPEGVRMGQRLKMSQSDIIKLNKVYDCPPRS